MGKNQIWIKQWNTVIRLPVLPPSIEFSMGQDNVSVKLEKIGETTIIQTPSLFSCSLSSQFPLNWFPSCDYKDFMSPNEFVDIIDNMKKTGTIRFIVTGTRHNYEMTIEDFSISERSGDPGTIYFDISLKEYRPPTMYRVEVSDGKIVFPKSLQTRRSDNRVIPETYTAIEGDYLIKIAKMQLGRESEWTEILSLNRNILNNNPNNLKPGMTLKLPTLIKHEQEGRA